jgi:peptide subunit release factor 1 (eRF1)
LLERLDQSAGKNGRAAVGLEAVLEGLNQQRVETAILDPSFQAPLRQCPSCRLLTLAAASSCPADGSDLRLLEDGAEAIIRRALGQDGDVVLLSAQGAITADDGLAATLRF